MSTLELNRLRNLLVNARIGLVAATRGPIWASDTARASAMVACARTGDALRQLDLALHYLTRGEAPCQ